MDDSLVVYNVFPALAECDPCPALLILLHALGSLPKKNYMLVRSICDLNDVEYDKNILGMFMTVYFKNIPSDFLNKRENIENLFLKTNMSCIPGANNYFNTEFGFCFRINLLRIEKESLKILENAFIFLKKMKLGK